MVFFQKEKQKSLDRSYKTKIALIRQFVFYGFERRNINILVEYRVNFSNSIDCEIIIMRLNIKIFLLNNYKNIGGKSTNERKKIISNSEKYC